MEVKIKKLSEGAVVPTKGTKGAAAFDLYVPKDTFIDKGRQVIPLDLAIEIPYGYEGHIQSRSGYASKGFEGYGVDKVISYDEETSKIIDAIIDLNFNGRVDCDVLDGKIDSDFRGNIGVIIHNRGLCYMVKKGQRIAQLTIRKVEDADFIEVEELSETERGDGGYGSTGK